MPSEQELPLKDMSSADRNARFVQLSQKACDGQPLYHFLVQCSSQATPESHLIVQVTVETPSLEAVSRAVGEAVGDCWKCQQVWLPVQDWLSTGALMSQSS